MNHIALFGFLKKSKKARIRNAHLLVRSVGLEVNINLSLNIKVEYDLSYVGSVLSLSNAIG